jgi:hypothetical protein
MDENKPLNNIFIKFIEYTFVFTAGLVYLFLLFQIQIKESLKKKKFE